MSAIDFYFDFSSPYGYLAANLIDDIAARHSRDVSWKPYLMGAAFKRTGRAPLVDYDLVSNYSRRDIERSARLHSIDIRIPGKFPVASIAACRAYYALVHTDPAAAKMLAMAIYRAYFVDDRAISDRDVVLAIAAELGHDADAMRDAINDPEVKERVRSATDDAIEAGVFGSPFIVIDGEPFWGTDRLPHVERWLETGGW